MPKSEHGYRVAIINPLTLVGAEVKSILLERSFPYWRIELFDSTGTADGSLSEVADEPALITQLQDDSLSDVDIAFFCGPEELNRKWLDRAGPDAFVAINLSRPTGLEPKEDVIVAGVNSTDLSAEPAILECAHPAATPVALLLHQLARFNVTRCVATVVQPASEFGQDGIDELFQQTISVLNVASIPTKVFDRQLAFNLYPSPSAAQDERLVNAQLKSVLSKDIEISVSMTQGTTFHSHTFSIFVFIENDATEEEVAALLSRSEAIAVSDDSEGYSTIDAGGSDFVLVSRIKQDDVIAGGFWIWAVSDNLRRSSSLNAVMIAEAVVAAGYSVN